MRSVFLIAVLALSAFAPVAAGAEALPPYEGGMTFQVIQGPKDPEEFSWEVSLGEGQELRQVDDRKAQVFYTDPEEHLAFSITAIAAHDAEGATVPTSIVVTQPNVITLNVHHRDGNPNSGGAPFDYPVLAGQGWEGGFRPVQILGPPDESSLSSIQPSSEPVISATRCSVPDLGGRTLRAARKMLNRAHCALGPIRGERTRGARVIRQYRAAGKSLPAGSEVGVKLLHP